MTEKQKILIVEDEALIADNLAAIVEELGYTVTGIVANASEALKSLKNILPDICLLDISLDGGIDGIDLAEMISKKFQVPHIFITSFSDATTIERAKETSPSAYIIKPYTDKEVEINLTLALYKKRENPSPSPLSSPPAFSPSTAPVADEKDSFFIKDKHEFIRIRHSDISYCEAADNYTIIYTHDNKYILSQTMKNVLEKLEDHGFIRVHRSYFVRFRDIESIGPNYIMIQQQKVPMSQQYRHEILARIQLI